MYDPLKSVRSLINEHMHSKGARPKGVIPEYVHIEVEFARWAVNLKFSLWFQNFKIIL